MAVVFLIALECCRRQASVRGGDIGMTLRRDAIEIWKVGVQAADSAAERARQLGYVPLTRPENLKGEASAEGRRFLQLLMEARRDLLASNSGVKGICLLAGGETTVNVASAGSEVGKGGRNQEFVLAAAVAMPDFGAWHGMVVLSGGTDGEDGPTETAGAVCDADVVRAIGERGLRAAEFLRRHDAWTCFREAQQGLIVTGPTHTNVMDLAVGLAGREWGVVVKKRPVHECDRTSGRVCSPFAEHSKRV